MKYSIVISTYNRANLMKLCLEALSKQNIPASEYEIIVVNDGSFDNTGEIAGNFKSLHPEINFIYKVQTNGGPSKGRNAGIALSTGEIILFTDDDCIVPERWVETLADGYKKHPEVAGVGGLYEFPPYILNKSLFARYHTFKMRNIWYGPEGIDKEIINNIFSRNPAGNTSNMSYRKEILTAVGGFDETITYPGFDDTDLKKRIMDGGAVLLYLPYNIKHIHPMGSVQIIRRFFNFGRGRYRFAQKYKNSRRKNMSKNLPQLEFKAIALADSFFTQCGWEFEKMSDKIQPWIKSMFFPGILSVISIFTERRPLK